MCHKNNVFTLFYIHVFLTYYFFEECRAEFTLRDLSITCCIYILVCFEKNGFEVLYTCYRK